MGKYKALAHHTSTYFGSALGGDIRRFQYCCYLFCYPTKFGIPRANTLRRREELAKTEICLNPSVAHVQRYIEVYALSLSWLDASTPYTVQCRLICARVLRVLALASGGRRVVFTDHSLAVRLASNVKERRYNRHLLL